MSNDHLPPLNQTSLALELVQEEHRLVVKSNDLEVPLNSLVFVSKLPALNLNEDAWTHQEEEVVAFSSLRLD